MQVAFELPEITSKSLEYNGFQALACVNKREKGLLYKELRECLRLPLSMVAREMNVKQSIIGSFERGILKDSHNFEVLYQSYLQRNSMEVYSESSDFIVIQEVAQDAIDVLSIATGKRELLHKTCSTFVGYNGAKEIQ